MKHGELVLVLLLIVISGISNSHLDADEEQPIRLDTRSAEEQKQVRVSFKNDLPYSCEPCYTSTTNIPINTPVNNNNNKVCYELGDTKEIMMDTRVGDIFSISCENMFQNTRTFEIIGGKHVYNFSEYFRENDEIFMKNFTTKFVRVVSPNCPNYYYVIGPTWSDAIRVAAYRNGVHLCYCSSLNVASSYTVMSPNKELPTIFSDSACACPNYKIAIPEFYHFYLPCSHHVADDDQFVEIENCTMTQFNFSAEDFPPQFQHSEFPQKKHRRIFFLHSTVYIDRICMKHRTWESLKEFFGQEKASQIMPRSFYTKKSSDKQELLQLCNELVEKNDQDQVFITKTEDVHRQLGISIATAGSILATNSEEISKNFSFVTTFIPNPYLVNGYKINIRRYLLCVCVGGHLRAYVHDDGKNFYTPKPYKDPQHQKGLLDFLSENSEKKKATESNSNSDQKIIEKKKEILSNIITTGYVPKDHYSDKPMTGLEFFQYLTEKGKNYDKFLKSTWTRLALVVHVAAIDANNSLCEFRDEMLTDTTLYPRTEPIPHCLKDSIRFQNFGCDFHVDADLTGYESRMFECNKGPDFSVHSKRDGQLKRDVAADILSFVGFTGEFDGSEARARQFRLNLIYDSQNFVPEEAFLFLNSLNPKKAFSEEL